MRHRSHVTTRTVGALALATGSLAACAGHERTNAALTSRSSAPALAPASFVVRDTVTIGGELAEDTDDWFAQDRDGNVWYLGEETAEYDEGVIVSTAGSWRAGVDGALPGIVMPAVPETGRAYRQEFYAGEAEDMMEIVDVGGSLTVAAGSFDDVVTTRDWTPLEPDTVEEKSYASGVGMVRAAQIAGGRDVAELVEFSLGG